MTADPSPRFEKKAFHEEAASDSRFPSSPGPLSREAHYVMARNCFSPLPCGGLQKTTGMPRDKICDADILLLDLSKNAIGPIQYTVFFWLPKLS